MALTPVLYISSNLLHSNLPASGDDSDSGIQPLFLYVILRHHLVAGNVHITAI